MIDNFIKNKTYVSVFIVNGFQMRGVIVRQDAESIVLRHEHKESVVFKHAISTISLN